MSKDLQAIKYLNDTCINFLDRTKKLYCTVTFTRKRAEILRDNIAEVEQALQRLESIDNANPSEALNVLKATEKYTGIDLTVVKNALLKAQEPKQYIKWEDLEFEKEEQWLKVKMGNNFYRMDWLIDDTDIKEVNLYKYITNDYLVYCACIRYNNQQFFNDLHLERVEE